MAFEATKNIRPMMQYSRKRLFYVVRYNFSLTLNFRCKAIFCSISLKLNVIFSLSRNTILLIFYYQVLFTLALFQKLLSLKTINKVIFRGVHIDHKFINKTFLIVYNDVTFLLV